MRENGPLLSRVVDPPGTKDGPRAGNFPGPPKNTFCPRWSHDPGQKGFLSRVVAPPGTKGPPYISSPRPLFQHLAFCAVDPPRRRRPELRAALTESSAPPPRELRAAAPRPRDRRRVVAPTTARR